MESFPQIGESAYLAVREALRRSVPEKITPAWIMANVPGYAKERSARTTLGQLRRLGLVDSEGVPTELAKTWRLDEQFDSACDGILRAAYPPDIVSALADVEPTEQVVVNLLMAKGLGTKTAHNAGRLLLLILRRTRMPSQPLKRPAKGAQPSSASKRETRRVRSVKEEKPEAETGGQIPPSPEMTVLRYFLDRQRIAELSIPSDITERELGRLFRHLEIDLRDHEPGDK